MATHAAQTDRRFTTRRLHPTFGLQIGGLDVSRPLGPEIAEALIALSAEHKLLLFREQSLSDAELNGFAQHFGDTNQAPPAVAGRRVREHNISKLGSRDDASKAFAGYDLLARFWHTDSSWRPVPTWLSFLTAIELPNSDGDTCFADMATAYDALSDERKALLADKQMIHSFATLRRYEPSIPPMGDNAPWPATHPVVRNVDGRKSLFLNGHAAHYIGNMPLEQGERLFDELMAHATAPAFVYQHKWSLGDLLVWDNRATMHRVMPYDRSQRRVMRRAEVMGTEVPE